MIKQANRKVVNLSGKKKIIFGIILIGIILVVAILFYNGMIGSTTKRVAVVIPVDSGKNLHLNFAPANITIVIGVNNTVVWKNEDTDWHTAHSDFPEFDSGLIQAGGSYTHVFERVGIYPYHCDPHPWMTGIVIVKSLTSSRN